MTVTLRNFGGRQKLTVIKVAYSPHPFPVSLRAQTQPVERQRALNPGHSFHGAYFLSSRRAGILCRGEEGAKFFSGELTVIIMFVAQGNQNLVGIQRQTLGLKRSRPPVAPCAVSLFIGGHAVNGVQNAVPVARAQRGANLPCQ